MTDSQITEVLKQLEADYENATFEVVEGKDFPDIEDIPQGKAVKLADVAYGYVDLRGFTYWSEQKRDKTVFKALEPMLRALTRVVRAHEGYIEKPTGDGLMFVIGANEANAEKVAVRALQCAIDLGVVIETVVNPFMKSKGHIAEGFKWGIGLEMGDALVTKVGIRGHHFLNSISKAANFASKLENLAGENQILVGEQLYGKAPKEVRENYLWWQAKLLGRDYYVLRPATDDRGKPTILKALSATQVRGYGLEKWLLGGAVALAALLGAKAFAVGKPHRWYGDEEE